MTDAVSVIGVPGAETADRGQLVDAVETLGGRAYAGPLDELLPADTGSTAPDVDALLAIGSDGLRAIASRRPDVPVLPIDAGAGVPSVSRDAARDAIAAVVEGAATTEPAPLLEVAIDGQRHTTAYREVTLITAEPAKISEFEIGGGAAGELDTVRADGVIVATPAGSHGYAAAGEGPLLEADTGLAIVPVAPFRTDRSRWVVPVETVSVRVQRDEAAVTVEADGEILATVGRGAELSLTPTATMGVLVVEASAISRP